MSWPTHTAEEEEICHRLGLLTAPSVNNIVPTHGHMTRDQTARNVDDTQHSHQVDVLDYTEREKKDIRVERTVLSRSIRTSNNSSLRLLQKTLIH